MEIPFSRAVVELAENRGEPSLQVIRTKRSAITVHDDQAIMMSRLSAITSASNDASLSGVMAVTTYWRKWL